MLADIRSRKLHVSHDRIVRLSTFDRTSQGMMILLGFIMSLVYMQAVHGWLSAYERLVNSQNFFSPYLTQEDMSRIGRNYLEVGLYTEMLFPEHDVRFIAVNSGVDSANQQDNDFTPFLNIINEFYVKDSSKKVKAVMKQKGESGEYLTTNPPYGYMKDPDNPKRHWIVDDEAAAVVRQIFAWCMEGFGPSQIAKKLKEAKVDCPTVHWMKMGRNAPAKTPDNPYDWAPRTITGILEKQEYLGHMVNFKTRKQSYKSKKKLENPPDQWKIFENTHLCPCAGASQEQTQTRQNRQDQYVLRSRSLCRLW